VRHHSVGAIIGLLTVNGDSVVRTNFVSCPLQPLAILWYDIDIVPAARFAMPYTVGTACASAVVCAAKSWGWG